MMGTTRTHLVSMSLFVTLVLLSSCNGEYQLPQSEVISENGVEIRVNYRPVRDSIPGEIVPAEDLFIIDDMVPEMPIEAAIGGIRDIIAGPDGEFVVLDWRLNELKVFDSSGAFIRRFGKPGGGPGEFEQVAWMLTIHRDRITVLDQYPSILKFFDFEGGFINQFLLPPSTSAVAPDPEGGYFTTRSFRQGGRDDYTYTHFIQRLNEDGRPRSFDVRGTAQDSLVIAITTGPTGNIEYPQNHPNITLRYGPDGITYAVGENYTIYRITDNGIISGFRRHTEPTRYPSWWLDDNRAQFRESGREPPEIIGYKEGINNFVVDERGHIWVLPFVGAKILMAKTIDEMSNQRFTTLEEFDPRGRWLRQVLVEVPAPASGLFLKDAANGYLYGILVGIEMDRSMVARIRRP